MIYLKEPNKFITAIYFLTQLRTHLSAKGSLAHLSVDSRTHARHNSLTQTNTRARVILLRMWVSIGCGEIIILTVPMAYGRGISFWKLVTIFFNLWGCA